MVLVQIVETIQDKLKMEEAVNQMSAKKENICKLMELAKNATPTLNLKVMVNFAPQINAEIEISY